MPAYQLIPMLVFLCVLFGVYIAYLEWPRCPKCKRLKSWHPRGGGYVCFFCGV